MKEKISFEVNRDQRLYEHVVKNNNYRPHTNYKQQVVLGREKKLLFAHLTFNIEERDMVRFKKAYIGVVEDLGMSYNVQNDFHIYTRVLLNPCYLYGSESVSIRVKRGRGLKSISRGWN